MTLTGVPLRVDTVHRPDLQGLRAVAVLGVIAAHTDTPFVGGFVGVDVFFVLSGYLITGLLAREWAMHGDISLWLFYARRLLRLMPALVFMLGAILALAYCVLTPHQFVVMTSSSPWVALWATNLHFMSAAQDYFNELSSSDLFLHTWSLGVEEQFYLVWPVLLMLLLAFSMKSQSPPRWMVISIGIISLLSCLTNVALMECQPIAAFYLAPSRLWEFGMGAMLHWFPQNEMRDRRLWNVAGMTGLSMISGACILFSPFEPYPGWRPLLPAFGALLVILAGRTFVGDASHVAWSRKLLSVRGMVMVGDHSYSLYLWHWPLLAMAGVLAGYDSIWGVILAIMLTVLLSVFSKRYLESPFRSGATGILLGRKFVLSCIFLSAVCFAVTATLLSSRAEVDIGRLMSDSVVSMEARWRMDVPDVYDRECDSWYSSDELQPCEMVRGDGGSTLVILGDSVLLQWYSALAAAFPEPKWTIIVLTKSSCPMVDESFFYRRIGKVYDVCDRWREAAIDWISDVKPTVVVVGGASSYPFDEQQWIQGSQRVFERLSSVATQVLVVPGTPSLSVDAPACAVLGGVHDGRFLPHACLEEGRTAVADQVGRYLEVAGRVAPNLHTLRLNDLVCPDNGCSATDDGGVLIFRDFQHLTDTFVRNHAPVVSERVRALLGDRFVHGASY